MGISCEEPPVGVLRRLYPNGATQREKLEVQISLQGSWDMNGDTLHDPAMMRDERRREGIEQENAIMDMWRKYFGDLIRIAMDVYGAEPHVFREHFLKFENQTVDHIRTLKFALSMREGRNVGLSATRNHIKFRVRQVLLRSGWHVEIRMFSPYVPKEGSIQEQTEPVLMAHIPIGKNEAYAAYTDE